MQRQPAKFTIVITANRWPTKLRRARSRLRIFHMIVKRIFGGIELQRKENHGFESSNFSGFFVAGIIDTI